MLNFINWGKNDFRAETLLGNYYVRNIGNKLYGLMPEWCAEFCPHPSILNWTVRHFTNSDDGKKWCYEHYKQLIIDEYSKYFYAYDVKMSEIKEKRLEILRKITKIDREKIELYKELEENQLKCKHPNPTEFMGEESIMCKWCGDCGKYL